MDLESRVQAAARLDFNAKLLLLAGKMRDEVVRILSPFILFMQSYKLPAAHNMLALMLDPATRSSFELALTWGVKHHMKRTTI